MVADRVQKVGLAQSGGPVDEERVVRPGRAFGDAQRRGVCEAVGGADHELVEGVSGIQLGAGPGVGGCHIGLRRSGAFHDDIDGDVGRGLEGIVGVGPGRRVDHQLDRVRNAGEGLYGVGEQPDVARADPIDGHRARNTEHQRLVGAVEGVDALEPGVPGGLGKLSPNRCRDLCPKVVCRWSAHVDSPIVHSYVHTCGEATGRLAVGATPGPGWLRRLCLPGLRRRGHGEPTPTIQGLAVRRGSARYRPEPECANKSHRTPLSDARRAVVPVRCLRVAWIADVRDLPVHSLIHLCARAHATCRAPAPGPHLGPGVRGGHG